jgi:serine/threonine-protein kinase
VWALIGQTVSHYHILEKLGEGGMGEVYRAHDTRLNRDVALKILPQVFARDSQRMARFEREAQVLASLNHAHIAQIHGLEETGGTKALVLELVQGESLADRIARGPIPVDEALKIALQICEGLEAAHEKGIIHRDLKPANIKITPEGEVKILDFGLAKAMEGEAPISDLSHSPTITHAATEVGVILGTASYMSPEQARGKPVDKRTDVWAFGCVLYEMLSGRRAFEGDCITDLLASITREEPNWSLLPNEIPPSANRLLRRCLTKDVHYRLRDIGDAWLTFNGIRSVEAKDTPFEDPSRWWHTHAFAILCWAVFSTLLLSAVLPWLFLRPEPGGEGSRTRFSINTSGWELPIDAIDVPILDISRDGTQIVFTSEVEGLSRLFLRRIDEFEARRLEGTEGGTSPQFSPDGQWIIFLSEGRLKKVSTRGTPVLDLCEVSSGNRGAWWGDDDQIVFSPGYQSALFEVPESGGVPTTLTELDRASEERTHRWPQVLPGGDSVLFTIGFLESPAQYDNALVAVYTKSTGERKILVEGGHMARYLSSGHLVYLRSGVLFAAPFDLEDLELTRVPVPVSEIIGGEPSSGVGYFAVSDNGTLLYRPGQNLLTERRLVLADRGGNLTPLPLDGEAYNSPSFSPDGNRLVYGVGTGGGGNDDIWIFDFGTNLSTRLTFSRTEILPLWSPDGQFVYYFSFRGKRQGIYRKPYDGRGEEELVFLSTDDVFLLSGITPDTRTLLGTLNAPSIQIIQVKLEKEGKAKLEQFGTGDGYHWGATFSPDYQWIAYTSNETGTAEVYVQPASGSGKWQISTDGGVAPIWGPDGRELFFGNHRGVFRAEVSTEEEFRHGSPGLLFSGSFLLQTPPRTNFDISPDGKLFALVQAEDSAEGHHELRVSLNWFEELKRLVPADD